MNAISNVVSLQEAREALHVSVSQLKTFLICPEKFVHTYVFRTPSETRAAALVFGAAFHGALEIFYDNLKGQGAPNLEDLLEAFTIAWEGACDSADHPIEFGRKDDAESLLEKGRLMLTAFFEHGHRPAEVLGIEVPFAVTLPGREEQLVGAFDLVARDEGGGVLIVEHKTAARKWSADQLRYDLQATAYQYAARQLGLGDVEVAYQVIAKTKNPVVELHRVERSEGDIDEMLHTIDGVYRAVDAGAFWPVRSWACAGCGFAEVCGKR